MKLLAGFIVLTFSTVATAADIPTYIEGAQHLTQEECLIRTSNECISSVCPTSSDTDCNEKCKAAAVDQCKESTEE